MKALKKSISVVLALMMVIGLFSVSFSASAAEAGSVTAAGGSGKITVKSNVKNDLNVNYQSYNDQVTITFLLETDHFIVNTQGYLTYDNTVLRPVGTVSRATCMPRFESGSTAFNSDLENKITFNASNISYYDFYDRAIYFTITFDIVGTGDTTVNFDIQYLTGNDNDDYNQATSANDISLIDNSEVKLNEFTYTLSAALSGSAPSSTTTIYAAAPVFAEGTTVDNWCIGYSNDANVTNLTTIEMTKTDKEYFLGTDVAGSLKKNVNLAVYKAELTDAQVAAIDAASYVGFMTKIKTIRTKYTWSKCVLRANIDRSGYTNTKHTVSEVNGKMFVINAADTLENKREFGGNWVSSSGSDIVSTIYAVSPKSTSGDMENVYFRYGSDSNVIQANNIFMTKTDQKFNNTKSASNMSTGLWDVYKLNVTTEQAAEINAANYTGFSSPYSASVRTLYNYSNSVTRANVGSYNATYGSKSNVQALDGKVFVINDSTGSNTTSYKGYWADLATATEIAKVTINVAVPNRVNGRDVSDVSLIYSNSADISTATKIAATKTSSSYTPSKNYSSLIDTSKGWTLYTLTLTANQYNEIQKASAVGFNSKYNYMATTFNWGYNVLRAGVGTYESPYDTNTTAKFADLDGKTFVICGNSAAKQTAFIGYWV